MTGKIQILAAKLARADTAFWLLPMLMALLVAGTLAQKSMGLYAAQEKFFASFFFFAGPVPLPGGYTLLGLLSFSLLLKFLLHSDWHLRKAGINLAHAGVLVILFGGLATSLTAREGYIVIPEGEQGEYVYDYHLRQLYIFENDALKKTVDFGDLDKEISGLPFEIKTVNTCANCSIVNRADAKTPAEKPQGMARFMALEPQAASPEPEADIAGVTFTLRGLKNGNGTHIAFEGMPQPIVLRHMGKTYKIIFGKQQRLLPFALRLEKFTKETYPGTDAARAYSSALTIRDSGLDWPALIEMNKPLRHKGYTFYQSSFEQTPKITATILAVVENRGRLLPYIGTAIIAAGLLLHLLIALQRKEVP